MRGRSGGVAGSGWGAPSRPARTAARALRSRPAAGGSPPAPVPCLASCSRRLLFQLDFHDRPGSGVRGIASPLDSHTLVALTVGELASELAVGARSARVRSVVGDRYPEARGLRD